MISTTQKAFWISSIEEISHEAKALLPKPSKLMPQDLRLYLKYLRLFNASVIFNLFKAPISRLVPSRTIKGADILIGAE
jgi:hypothetical protein